MKNTYKILMVCLGNICRSPLAEGVLKRLIQDKGLTHLIEVDSAGTAAYHVGKIPDIRSREVAQRNGFQLEHRGRQLIHQDLIEFDLILVMDEENLKNTRNLALNQSELERIKLITDFDLGKDKSTNVEDPYWGDQRDFDRVYAQLNSCCQGLLTYLESEVFQQ